jgi:hypothetical protein
MYWGDDDTVDTWSDDLHWIADPPGRESPWWKRRPEPEEGDRYPFQGPKYEVDDRLIVYFTRLHTCPGILRVTGEPRWAPSQVDEESWAEGQGERWGVVTPVEKVSARPAPDGPELEEIDVTADAIRQKGHLALTQAQYDAAHRLITGRSPRGPGRTSPRQSVVSTEQGKVAGYDYTPRTQVASASRREHKLVSDYEAYLRARGNKVGRNKLRGPEAPAWMFTDLFNVTRRQLIEAKASTDRNDVRMAIGQRGDYARFIHPPPERAILVPAKPRKELLDLLRAHDIGVIWRQGTEFRDDAGGRFTSS